MAMFINYKILQMYYMSKNTIIFDASTLILLAKITLLRSITTKISIIIAGEVRKEAIKKKTFDGEIINQLLKENKISLNELQWTGMDMIMNDFNMDFGEAESILLAKKQEAVLATDDKAAIKACKVLNIPFTTALNLLVLSCYLGLLTKHEALLKLKSLEEYGRYSPEIIKNAKQKLEGENHD